MPKLQCKASLTIQTVNDYAAEHSILSLRFPITIAMRNSGWQVPDYLSTRILLLRGMFTIHHLHELPPLECNISSVCFKKFHVNHRLNFSHCWQFYYLKHINLFAITHLPRPGIKFDIDWLVTTRLGNTVVRIQKEQGNKILSASFTDKADFFLSVIHENF